MKNDLFKNITQNEFINFNKDQLNNFFKFYESISREREELIEINKILEEKIIEVEGQLILLKRRQYRKRSEKIVPTEEEKNTKEDPNKKRKKRETVKLLPSERWSDPLKTDD